MAQPQPLLNKVFCIIDPSTVEQRALSRSAAIAAATGAAVHAYCCFSITGDRSANERADLEAAEFARHRAWLDVLLAPLRERGITVAEEVECQDDWREALAKAARRANADLIVRATVQRSALRRRVLKTTDWMLLREAHCPVLLVKSERDDAVSRVLAAVNVKASDEPHQRLTEQVIEYARAVADLAGAELHAVNAFHGSENFVHPPDLARRLGIERRCAHVGDSAPEVLVAQVAEKIEASLVVVGSLARKGLSGAVVGNTAERILDGVPADLLCIIAQPE
jgi:universal stress protein E